jgi:hypothetical protein
MPGLATTLWACKFHLTADMFTEVLELKLTRNEKLTVKLKCLLVRELAQLIEFEIYKPSKRAIEILAERMVKIFPCLLEEIDGCTVGSGYDGLAMKLARYLEKKSIMKIEESQTSSKRVNVNSIVTVNNLV